MQPIPRKQRPPHCRIVSGLQHSDIDTQVTVLVHVEEVAVRRGQFAMHQSTKDVTTTVSGTAMTMERTEATADLLMDLQQRIARVVIEQCYLLVRRNRSGA